MVLDCTFPGLAPPPPIGPPAWADPAGLMHASSWRFSLVTMTPGTIVAIAKADPKRLMLGLAWGSASVTNFFISPAGNPIARGWPVGASPSPIWYSIFNYGPMVCADWTGLFAGNFILTVYEIYSLF